MKKILIGIVVMTSFVLPMTVRAEMGDTEASFRTSLREFQEAWTTDAKAVASFWVNDGTLISPVGQQAKGLAEIEKVISADKENIVLGGKMKFSLLSLRQITPDVVFVDLQNDVVNRIGPEGKVLPSLQLHVAAVATRKNNKWMWIDVRPYAFLPVPSARMSSKK